MATAPLRSRASAPGGDRSQRLRSRLWRATEARVELLAELSLLAEEADHDLYVRQSAVAVAEHLAGACVIALRRGTSDALSVASHVAQGRPLVADPASPFPEMARRVLQAGRGLVIDAEGAGERGQALLVPLRARGRFTGALGVTADAPVSPDGVRYLQEVCARIATTVELLRLDRDGGRSAGARAVPAPVPVLTQRERQVLGCVAAGMTSREAAAELGISKRTVEWHRERLKEKLGVSGRVALTRAAHEAGLG